VVIVPLVVTPEGAVAVRPPVNVTAFAAPFSVTVPVFRNVAAFVIVTGWPTRLVRLTLYAAACVASAVAPRPPLKLTAPVGVLSLALCNVTGPKPDAFPVTVAVPEPGSRIRLLPAPVMVPVTPMVPFPEFSVVAPPRVRLFAKLMFPPTLLIVRMPDVDTFPEKPMAPSSERVTLASKFMSAAEVICVAPVPAPVADTVPFRVTSPAWFIVIVAAVPVAVIAALLVNVDVPVPVEEKAVPDAACTVTGPETFMFPVVLKAREAAFTEPLAPTPPPAEVTFTAPKASPGRIDAVQAVLLPAAPAKVAVPDVDRVRAFAGPRMAPRFMFSLAPVVVSVVVPLPVSERRREPKSMVFVVVILAARSIREALFTVSDKSSVPVPIFPFKATTLVESSVRP
jgi:hypothetical protein